MALDTAPDVATEAESDASQSRARLAGAAAGALSLGISELIAGIFAGVPSLIVGVATVVIDSVPKPVKDVAIALFDTNDKVALGVGIVIVTLLIGAWVGPRARRDPKAGWIVFGAFGLLGGMAAARLGNSGLVEAVAAGVVAALAGVAALGVLLRLAYPDRPQRSRAGAHAAVDRRGFLVGAGSTVVFSMLAGLIGRNLSSSTTESVAALDDVTLPDPVTAIPPPTAEMQLSVDGISPLVTPNADFYRIDTSFVPPRIDAATWSMRITGMVDNEIELSYSDLLEMEMVERYITIACVSNEVGGGLVGNAKWLGIPLSDVLELAGVQSGAEQLVAQADRFTVGFPVEAAFDGRDALLAVAMNDEPLPIEHGFPARLVVAGLYGYVSATKWLEELHLTTWDGFDAYWIPRGWAKEAPIKTMARIDTPRPGGVRAGTRAIAGVAWAPNIGISNVEVRIDGGDWQTAELAASLDDDSWRQWALEWTPEPGTHTIEARATNANGDLQTEIERPPAPDGASGYHTITVSL